MLMKATVAPSQHTESAKAFMEKIRAIGAEFPRFTLEGLGNARAQNGGAVPEKFVESASVAVQKSIRLEQAGGVDATTLRDAYAYVIAFEPVVQELLALAQFVANTIRVQRNEAGLCALDVYNLAKRMSKRKDGAELIPFVEDMRVKLGKKGRPRKAESETAPAPVAVVDPVKK